MHTMPIPSIEQLKDVIDEACYQALGYWDRDCSPEENRLRFKEYDRLTLERQKALGYKV